MAISGATALPIPTVSTKITTEPLVARRSANYHPSIWGDHFFVAYTSHPTEVDVNMEEELHQLKQKVIKMLVAAADKASQMLNLIDGIQRLEVFNKFKNNQGKFQECLIGDVVGILSLYEATHLRVHGEEILDEALTFTTTHLESMVPNLSNPIGEHVAHALNQPIHKGLTRIDARHYISFYEQDDSHNKDLSNFAKLDFNLLQKLHQREPSEITRWWKDLDFAKKLPFARDRLVECYFWILGVYFEPQYWPARRILTKVIAMTSIIDDIYDVYGTLEELVLFTDAIERWEISALDQLPEYMKLCYRSLLDVYSMIDEEMAKHGGSYRVDYAKSEMKNLVRGYFEEAKWFHQGCVPSMEEYMQVGLLTCGYKMLATVSYVGMGELATKEAFDWVSSFPLIVEAASVINRLTDDIVGHKRGHVVSAVECYMKQHGATEEEAVVELYEQVTNAWKDMNAACLYSTKVPMPLLVRVLNLARVINVLYKTHILEPGPRTL